MSKAANKLKINEVSQRNVDKKNLDELKTTLGQNSENF